VDQEQIDRFNEKQKDAAEKQRLLDAVSQSALDISQTIVAAEKHTKDVNIVNDLAKPSDIQAVVSAVEGLKNDLRPQDIAPLVAVLNEVRDAISKLPTEFPEAPELPEAPEPIESVDVTNLEDLKPYFDEVVNAVSQITSNMTFDPKIDVKPADVIVNEKEVDLKPLVKAMEAVKKSVDSIQTPVFDTSNLMAGLKAVKDTINNLTFPSPNYILPFKDSTTGKATQVILDSDSALPIGGLLGGVSYDYVGMSNADGNGNYQTIVYKRGGSSGTTVRTLTYTYDASNNVTSITRS